MIKTLFSMLVIVSQMVLVSKIAENKSTEQLVMILLVALIPYAKGPFIRLAEEREKQLRLKNKESQG